MSSGWLADLRADFGFELGRLRRVEVAASIVTLALIGLFNSLIQAAGTMIISAVEMSLLAGLDVAHAARMTVNVLIVEITLVTLMAFFGGVLAAALAVRTARALLVNASPTPVCILTSILVLLFGVAGIWLTQGIHAAFPVSWVLAANLPGWIIGLPLGGGQTVRNDYQPTIICGLGVPTIGVLLAVLIVPHLMAGLPGGYPLAALGSAVSPLPRTAAPVFHKVNAPDSQNSRGRGSGSCHAEATGQGAFGEGSSSSEAGARAMALSACGSPTCWITVARCD